MTPTEINKKIATWLGWTDVVSRNNGLFGILEERQFKNKRRIPDYYNTNAAFDLLDVLIERGYKVSLKHLESHEWLVCIWTIFPWIEVTEESKSAAICLAICKIIDRVA